MNNHDRDTHFRRFAELVWEEMKQQPVASFATGSVTESVARYEQHMTTLLAQRAYDLLVHDRMHTGTIDLQVADSTLEAEEMVSGVPDLTAWPDLGRNDHE